VLIIDEATIGTKITQLVLVTDRRLIVPRAVGSCR
jgi:hypothetical protein